MNQANCLIALGGNIGDTAHVFSKSVGLIKERIGVVEKVSSWHETEPVLHSVSPQFGQRNYLNGAVLVRAGLEPEKVLQNLLAIEAKLGRDRAVSQLPWSSRIIDLDLLGVGDLVINSPNLTLPHPLLHQRCFVLKPLAEIAPDWVHPVLKKSVREMLSDLEEKERGKEKTG